MVIGAGLSGGAHVVFDYSDSPTSLAPELQAAHRERAARVAGIGEPWVSYFEAKALHAELIASGSRTSRIWDRPRLPHVTFPTARADARQRRVCHSHGVYGWYELTSALRTPSLVRDCYYDSNRVRA